VIPFILPEEGKMDMNKLYIITGPAGVGKSTVSKNIASSLAKSVLIEGDDIYNQFVGGRISPWKENAPLDLFWKNSSMLIKNYLEEGYDVVFNYIIKKGQFNRLAKMFKNYDIKFTVLLVDEETIVKRDNLREPDCRMGERSLVLLNELKRENYDSKYILDSSNLTVEETSAEIINNDRFTVKRISIDEIRTPEDILKYLMENISYGWLDNGGHEHIGNMKNFRRLYKTSSLDEILQHNIGTCIEQVNLMHHLLTKIGVKSKMFCTRIYENESFDELDSDEHMHCFILYYLDDKVYQIEHPNREKIGIHEYNSEEEAISSINKYYVELSGGISRPVTEFFEVPSGLSFKEFNLYINNLDKNKKLQKTK
jgi:adenylate kinase family enzyme